MDTATYSLGLDVGGTKTRFALVARREAGFETLIDSHVPGFHGMMLADEAGRALVRSRIEAIAAALHANGLQRPQLLNAGVTGYDKSAVDAATHLREIFKKVLGIKPENIILANDVESAYLAYFLPGEGYLLYAGTGSIAAFVDQAGEFHHAGGRGGIIGDAGAAYWIAVSALTHIWRTEDEAPGAWKQNPLATNLFQAMGGRARDDVWQATRELFTRNDRGEIGMLARAVARAAHDGNADALAIFDRGADELARLGHALVKRFGAKPIALSGGSFLLHPSLIQGVKRRLDDLQIIEKNNVSPQFSCAIRALLLSSPRT